MIVENTFDKMITETLLCLIICGVNNNKTPVSFIKIGTNSIYPNEFLIDRYTKIKKKNNYLQQIFIYRFFI